MVGDAQMYECVYTGMFQNRLCLNDRKCMLPLSLQIDVVKPLRVFTEIFASESF